MLPSELERAVALLQRATALKGTGSPQHVASVVCFDRSKAQPQKARRIRRPSF
jgi:hypothetical protein